MQPLRFKLTNTTDCNILSFFHSFGIPILSLSRFNRIQQPHAHQLLLFVVKFNRQTCQMYMETRRYVYTYFILGQRIHCDENICQCEHTFRFVFIVPTRMGRTLPFDYHQWKFFIAIIFFIELYFFLEKIVDKFKKISIGFHLIFLSSFDLSQASIKCWFRVNGINHKTPLATLCEAVSNVHVIEYTHLKRE